MAIHLEAVQGVVTDVVDPTAPAAPARPTGEAVAQQMVRTSTALARHPRDGWVLADPYPMSKGLVRKFHGLIRALTPQKLQVPDVEVRIEQQVRRMMRYMQPLVAKGFKVIIRLLDWAPIYRFKSWRRLHKLPPERASAIIEGMANSRIGVLGDIVVAARAAVLAPYYDLGEVAHHVGYRPEPFMRQRIQLREQLMGGAPPAAADRIGPHSDAAGSHTLPSRAELEGDAS